MESRFSRTLLVISLLAIPLLAVFSQERVVVFSMPFYVPEVLTGIAFMAFLFSRRSGGEVSPPRWDAFFLSLFLIALGLVLSSSANDMTLHGYGRMKSWFFFPLVYGGLLAVLLERKAVAVEDILRAVFFGGLLVGVTALLGAFFGDGLSYDHRLHGWGSSPNHLAMFLGAAMIAGLALPSSFSGNRERARACILIGALFLGGLLLLTQSYAVIFSIISVACIGMALCWQRFSRRQMFAALFLCLLCIGVLFFLSPQKWRGLASFDGRSSLASRGMIWQASFRMIADHPIIGIGPGNFQREYLRYQQYFAPYLEWSVPHPHDTLLDFWLEGGLLGFLGSALLFWYWLSSAVKHVVSQEKRVAFRALPLLLGIYFFLVGLADAPLLRNDLAYLFTSLLVVSRFFFRDVSGKSSHRAD